MKQLLYVLFSMCLLLSCACPAGAIDAVPSAQYTDSMEAAAEPAVCEAEPAALSDGTGLMYTLSTSGTSKPAFGIDVSEHQKKIDWNTVSRYIDFAIIRCGYGMDLSYQDDSCWKYNVSECERLGIPYGVYLYSYAPTAERAASEARHAIRLLKGHHPTLPVFYDIENEAQEKLTKAQFLANATAFCSAIKAAGYTPGVYTFHCWWDDKMDLPEYDQWPRWVAHRDIKQLSFPKTHMLWQYTVSTLPGIPGTVSLDYLYYGLNARPGGWHCGGGPACVSHGYRDMPGIESWTHAGIDYCVERGLMKGVSKTRFAPNDVATRAQIAEVLYRISNSPNSSYSGRFMDVQRGEWYTGAVEWAARKGIVQGTGKNRFSPEASLTREQLVTILYRYSGAKASGGSLSAFPDAGKVSDYARDAMRWATAKGIIQGELIGGVKWLRPKAAVTRAELASIIMRYLKS